MLVNGKEERRKKEDETFSATCYWTPTYSKVCSRVYLLTARQYHSISACLVCGIVASLAIILLVYQNGKFEISLSIRT